MPLIGGEESVSREAMEAENARDAMVKEALQQAHERMRRHREGVEAQEKRTAWRARGRSRGGARTLSSAAAAEQTPAVGARQRASDRTLARLGIEPGARARGVEW